MSAHSQEQTLGTRAISLKFSKKGFMELSSFPSRPPVATISGLWYDERTRPRHSGGSNECSETNSLFNDLYDRRGGAALVIWRMLILKRAEAR